MSEGKHTDRERKTPTFGARRQDMRRKVDQGKKLLPHGTPKGLSLNLIFYSTNSIEHETRANARIWIHIAEKYDIEIDGMTTTMIPLSLQYDHLSQSN